nr:DUF4327 family protein [Roseofilum casamattae]
MAKLQSKIKSLVDSQILKPTDGIWKMAFLYGDKWEFWKEELEAYDFSMQDPVSEILAVDEWEG